MFHCLSWRRAFPETSQTPRGNHAFRRPGPFINTFFYNETAVAAHHVLRRDWPSPGDASYANFQDHGAQQEMKRELGWLQELRTRADGRVRRLTGVLFCMPGSSNCASCLPREAKYIKTLTICRLLKTFAFF